MDKVIINLAVEEQDGTECEIIELGEVSTDTKGAFWGGFDGGSGLNPTRLL